MASTIFHGASCPRAFSSSFLRNATNRARSTRSIRSATELARRSSRLSRTTRRANAMASARASSASSSTTPSSNACRAAIGRPEVIRSKAASGPARRVKRWVPPAPGIRPSLTSGNPTLAVRAATRQWQANASSNPPPSAVPSIAATIGLSDASIRACTSRMIGDLCDRPDTISLMSAPAGNSRLAPEITMDVTCASEDARRRASTSPSRTGTLSAFTGGFSISRTATSASRR